MFNSDGIEEMKTKPSLSYPGIELFAELAALLWSSKKQVTHMVALNEIRARRLQYTSCGTVPSGTSWKVMSLNYFEAYRARLTWFRVVVPMPGILYACKSLALND